MDENLTASGQLRREEVFDENRHFKKKLLLNQYKKKIKCYK